MGIKRDIPFSTVTAGKNMEYFDEDRKDKCGMQTLPRHAPTLLAHSTPPYPLTRYVPHVIEPSFGVDRLMLAVITSAYAEDTVGSDTRTVLRFHPRLAPIKVWMHSIWSRIIRQLKGCVVIANAICCIGRRAHLRRQCYL